MRTVYHDSLTQKWEVKREEHPLTSRSESEKVVWKEVGCPDKFRPDCLQTYLGT